MYIIVFNLVLLRFTTTIFKVAWEFKVLLYRAPELFKADLTIVVTINTLEYFIQKFLILLII